MAAVVRMLFWLFGVQAMERNERTMESNIRVKYVIPVAPFEFDMNQKDGR